MTSYSFWPEIPARVTLEQSWDNLVRKTRARLFAITKTKYEILIREHPTQMKDIVCIRTIVNESVYYHHFDVSVEDVIKFGDNAIGCYANRFDLAVKDIRQYFKDNVS